jgi:general secretion pathway protein L
MAEWLIIRLAREPQRGARWIVADDAGRIVVQSQGGPLGEAVTLAAGRRVCVLVSGADVLVTEADVPVRSNAKIQQVVPFALEEHLADDIESLHFAVGRRTASGRLQVAVVARTLLDGWLTELKAAGLAPEAVYADSELVPANPGQAVALLDGEDVVLRMPDSAAVALPAGTFAAAFDLAQHDDVRGLIVYAEPDDWARRSGEVDALRERFDTIKVQLLPDGAVALFARELATAEPVNLLQGNYAPTSSFASGWRAWRVAAFLAAGLLGLHILGKALELGALTRAERRIDASIEEVFRKAMPGEQNTVDARRRMEQRLAAARGGGTGLLPALGAVAQARSGVPGTAVQNLSYREGMLDIRMSAPNAEALDRLSELLRSQGYDADLTSSSTTEAGYEGRLQLRVVKSS